MEQDNPLDLSVRSNRPIGRTAARGPPSNDQPLDLSTKSRKRPASEEARETKNQKVGLLFFHTLELHKYINKWIGKRKKKHNVTGIFLSSEICHGFKKTSSQKK